MSRLLSADSNLGIIDGFPVVQTTIKVTRAGDGLSKALKVDPHLLPLSGECTVVLRCKVGALTFRAGDGKHGVDDDEAVREQVLIAGDATIIDDESVNAAITEQAERIRLAEEAEQGIQRLPTDADDEESVLYNDDDGDDDDS